MEIIVVVVFTPGPSSIDHKNGEKGRMRKEVQREEEEEDDDEEEKENDEEEEEEEEEEEDDKDDDEEEGEEENRSEARTFRSLPGGCSHESGAAAISSQRCKEVRGDTPISREIQGRV
ncbi:hypothetical protein V1478_001159 [Vespula squamosa]|uniref:Uncharacterized protein n=1 Tax=Vespula squamosa TaxID=30214 RepID=A0ABD2C9M7_VESSQ